MRTLSPLDASLHPVRLACLIHAASVHSEPGSNSPWKKTYRGLTCRFRFMPRLPQGGARLSKYPEASGAHGAGRPAHRIALSCFQRGPGTLAPGLARACPLLSATVSRRRGAYFKPATRDCKSPAEDFSNLFPPARVFHTEGGRNTEGAGGGAGRPPVSATPLYPVGPGFLDF